MTKVLFITTLPFLMTDLAKLQKHVALIVVCYKLEVLHRGLRHSPIEVEAVCIELQSERYTDNAHAIDNANHIKSKELECVKPGVSCVKLTSSFHLGGLLYITSKSSSPRSDFTL